MITDLSTIEGNILVISQEIILLKEILDDLTNGSYIEIYIKALEKWIDENLQELVSKIVKYVVFGISSDGYFMAEIPDSWDFLKFDTVPEGQPLEGHLILEW